MTADGFDPRWERAHEEFAAGRTRVVRATLGRTSVPVMLVPVRASAPVAA